MAEAMLETKLEGLELVRQGKVRDVYDLGEYYLMITTDRISAFDCVFPNGIPEKGKILNRLALFWFEQIKDIIPNHIVSGDPTEYLKGTNVDPKPLLDRTMVVEKCKTIPVECVIRGYLEGSSVKDYNATGCMGGVKLPEGLQRMDQLPEPLYSPATKAETGHDVNIGYDDVVKVTGEETANRLRDISLKIYLRAHDYMKPRGIVLADTKFEFGWQDGELILIDEILTPDSSRYFVAEHYGRGKQSVSMDKQFVRDFAEGLDWDKTPPAPRLPDEIVEQTVERYAKTYELVTGAAPDFLG